MPSVLPRYAVLPEPAGATQGFYHPAVGEVFEPHRVHLDNEARRRRGTAPIYLPAIVRCQRQINDRKIGDGPKRVYEYLIGRAGENGNCWPGYELMADDLGKSPRQVQNDVRVLEELGLIAHEHRAGRKSNTYRFLWHPIFERHWTATQISRKIRSISGSEWQDSADLSGSGLPANLYKESSQKAAAADRISNSADSIQPVQKNVDASPSDEFGRNSLEVPEVAAAVEVSAALSRHGVAVHAPTEVPALIAVARENGIEPMELARFIEHKCHEKSTCGDPIRRVKFFFRCIPVDVVEFRAVPAKKQVEHSPPRFWKDPYGNLPQRGEAHA